MRKEKENVKEFYETFGWDKNAAGVYKDTEVFADLRPPSKWYLHKVITRTGKLLTTRGDYFMDVGSGPIPHPELLEYSSDFKWRVCVDFSRVALTEARYRLGQKALCVQADLANLPFRDGSFQAVFASHVLYHLPRDEQKSAVFELHRATAPGGVCLIVYSSGSSPETRLKEILTKVPGFRPLWRTIVKPVWRKKVKLNLSNHEHETKKGVERPFIHGYSYPYSWFQESFPQSWDMEMRVWACVGKDFTETYVPGNFLGFVLMKALFWLEMAFPHALLRLCHYPLIIIRRK